MLYFFVIFSSLLSFLQVSWDAGAKAEGIKGILPHPQHALHEIHKKIQKYYSEKPEEIQERRAQEELKLEIT